MMMFGRAFSQNGEMIQGDLRTIFSGQVSSQPIGRRRMQAAPTARENMYAGVTLSRDT